MIFEKRRRVSARFTAFVEQVVAFMKEKTYYRKHFCTTHATFRYSHTKRIQAVTSSLLFENPDDESASLPVTKLTILPSVGDSESDRIPFFVVNVMYSMKKE